jgi:hypothetical protein
MAQPTWQQIQAEAERRGKLAFETGGRTWTIAEMIVEVMREGWTPPDPRLAAFTTWASSRRSTVFIPDAQAAFYAGADWGENAASAERIKALENMIKLIQSFYYIPHLDTKINALLKEADQ